MSETQSVPIYQLGSEFYDRVRPAQFPQRIPRFLNRLQAKKLQWEELLCDQIAERDECQPFYNWIDQIRLYGQALGHREEDSEALGSYLLK